MPDNLNLSTDDFESMFLSPHNFSYMSRQSGTHSSRHSVQVVHIDGITYTARYPRSSPNSSTTSHALPDEEICPPQPQPASSHQTPSTHSHASRRPATPYNSRSSEDSISSFSTSLSTSLPSINSSLRHSYSSSSSTGLPWSPDPQSLAGSPPLASPFSSGYTSFERSRPIVSSPWTCLESAHHPVCDGKCGVVDGDSDGSLMKVARAPGIKIRENLSPRRSLRRMRSMIIGEAM